MLGGSSFQLGRILGIRIGVNASWFLILFLFIFWLSGRFTDVLNDQTAGYLAAVAAGPLVTLAIVILGSLVGVAFAGSSDFFDAARLESAAPSDVVLLLSSFLVTMNVFLL